jgi:predicted ATPase
MKITLKNFGAIYRFDFDTKWPIHCLYGSSNVGKSYAIRTFYLVLKNLKEQNEHFKQYFFGLVELKSLYFGRFVEGLSEQIAQGEMPLGAQQPLNHFIEKILKESLNNTFIPHIERSLAHTFSSDIQSKYAIEPVELLIESAKLRFNIRQDKAKHWYIEHLDLLQPYFLRFEEQPPAIIKEDKQIVLLANPKHFEAEQLKEDLMSAALALLQQLFWEVGRKYAGIYYLPASRSGLYQTMNAFGSVFAQLSQMRNLSDIPVLLPSLPEPVADYFLNLSTISQENHSDKFTRLAQEIEQRILEGQVAYNAETRQLEYLNRKSRLKLRMSEASSMISELAPLVAHLKYLLHEVQEVQQLDIFDETPSTVPQAHTQLLFVEAPEAHLHSQQQKEMAELFLRMPAQEVHLVIASNSQTLFKTMESLLQSEAHRGQRVCLAHLQMSALGSKVQEAQAPLPDTAIDFEDKSALLREKIHIQTDPHREDSHS